jgi:hypothetical protein
MQYFTNWALQKLVGGSSSTGTATKLDFVYTSLLTNNYIECVQIKPDATLLTGLYKKNPSIFNVKSGASAQIYYVLKGVMAVCSTDGWNSITGTINYLGTSFYSITSPTMPYRANITGKLVEISEFEF